MRFEARSLQVSETLGKVVAEMHASLSLNILLIMDKCIVAVVFYYEFYQVPATSFDQN